MFCIHCDITYPITNGKCCEFTSKPPMAVLKNFNCTENPQFTLKLVSNFLSLTDYYLCFQFLSNLFCQK